MKEMPGAPALPEGWFYRVHTRSFLDNGSYRCYVEVRRPFIFGWSIPWGGQVRVENGSWNFFSKHEKPSPGQLARAATKAFGGTDNLRENLEGDYR